MSQHRSPRLNRVARRFRSGVAHAVETGREEADDIFSAVQERAADASRVAWNGLQRIESQVRDLLDVGWGSVVKAEKQILNKVLANPGKSLLIAAGATLLFTYVCRANSREE